jgi:hypothetical protein
MRTHQQMPRVLVDGTSQSFLEAELRLREHIAKCYDFRLGYAAFTGNLAYVFTLATGEAIDVRALVGKRCSVSVLMADRSERTVAGDFQLARYRWRIATSDGILEIVPEHVTRIANGSDAAQQAVQIVHHDSYTGIGRMYREEPRPGCSGRPGFTVGVVDHAGAIPCPIHES